MKTKNTKLKIVRKEDVDAAELAKRGAPALVLYFPEYIKNPPTEDAIKSALVITRPLIEKIREMVDALDRSPDEAFESVAVSAFCAGMVAAWISHEKQKLDEGKQSIQ